MVYRVFVMEIFLRVLLISVFFYFLSFVVWKYKKIKNGEESGLSLLRLFALLLVLICVLFG